MKYRSAIQLLKKYLTGTASEEETAKVDKWYKTTEEKLTYGEHQKNASPEIKEKVYQRILSAIEQEKKVIPFYKTIFFRMAAAAAVVMFFTGLYFLYTSSVKQEIKAATVKPVLKNDIAPPGSNKAVLTLADGTLVNIDSAGNGVFAKQGDVNVIKQADGQIAYRGNTNIVAYNTLTVPKGSKPLKLNLADGSEVWLNVASSITYPTAFTGSERKVVITGEAYFEVAKNAAKPFIVQQAGRRYEGSRFGNTF